MQLTGALGVLLELRQEHFAHDRVEFVLAATPTGNEQTTLERAVQEHVGIVASTEVPGDPDVHTTDDGDFPEQPDEFIRLVAECLSHQVVRGGLDRRRRGP